MKNITFDFIKEAVGIARYLVEKELNVWEEKGVNNTTSYSIIEEGKSIGISLKDFPPYVESVEEAAVFIAGQFSEDLAGRVGELINSAIKEGKLIPFLYNPSFNEGQQMSSWDIIPGHLCLGLRALLGNSEEAVSSVVIDDSMLAMAGVERDDIDVASIISNIDVNITSPLEVAREYISDDVLNEMGLPEEMIAADSLMTIISRRDLNGLYGAAAVLKPQVLRRVAERMKVETFYLVPSSMDEMVTQPLDLDLDDLRESVSEVNGQFVLPGRVLSDEVYIYDTETDTIRLAGEEADESLVYKIS